MRIYQPNTKRLRVRHVALFLLVSPLLVILLTLPLVWLGVSQETLKVLLVPFQCLRALAVPYLLVMVPVRIVQGLGNRRRKREQMQFDPRGLPQDRDLRPEDLEPFSR